MAIALDFLNEAPEGAERVLQALAAAESLTDDLAREIYELAPLDGVSSDLFVRALHYADFVEPRNSEWNIIPEVRRELLGLGTVDSTIIGEAHRLLMRLGEEGDPALAGSVIPGYLFTDAGKAYHKAALGEVEEALLLYTKATTGPLTGAQWLASKFAQEQEERGVLPRGSIESTFLRAIVMFREGNRKEAQPLFRQVAETDQLRIEVAIAMHILGFSTNRSNRREAEALFHRSIEIGEQIDNQHHVAQTLHSLANLVGKDRSRADEAEKHYLRSIEIGEQINNQNHVAQTLHSLANVIGKDRSRADEAEKHYLRSIEIDEKLGNLHGVAQTLHSLANLAGKDRSRADEAEKHYLRSIEIGEQINNRNHVAQTLRSYSFVVEHRSPKEAEQLLERSLKLNQRARNRHGERLVLDSLKKLRARHDL